MMTILLSLCVLILLLSGCFLHVVGKVWRDCTEPWKICHPAWSLLSGPGWMSWSTWHLRVGFTRTHARLRARRSWVQFLLWLVSGVFLVGMKRLLGSFLVLQLSAGFSPQSVGSGSVTVEYYCVKILTRYVLLKFPSVFLAECLPANITVRFFYIVPSQVSPC